MESSDSAPVDIGDELVLEIEETGEEGDGIAHRQGFTIIVPGASLGERIEGRIRHLEADYAVAELVRHESGVD
ncbi:TRAM domain-containing protein [Haloarchaeobius amylolyticus]|uniref:TRAM domain-containing protein n=1 Tax=Haloarchaeobius amylolyticus TaxID=1198296 RepID=UPI00226D87EC|nr:TRAM domain-containing protein [Haloarchaeobius amylolyticus]